MLKYLNYLVNVLSSHSLDIKYINSNKNLLIKKNELNSANEHISSQ